MGEDSIYVEDPWGWTLKVCIKDYNDGIRLGTYIDGPVEGATVPLCDVSDDNVREVLHQMQQDELCLYDDSDDKYDEIRHSGEL